MTSNLKRLALDLRQLVDERGGSLDAPAREAFELRVDLLIRGIDEGDAAQEARHEVDALDLLAALLSVITNVMTLLK